MSTLPTYRHSEFETFAACPYAYAADLHLRAADDLGLYLCPDGERWVRDRCGQAYPIPVANYVTDNGTAMHRFGHAYGLHCQREGRKSDWSTGQSIASGLAGRNLELLNCCLFWMQQWEYDIPEETGGIPLVAGGFETGQSVKVDAHGREAMYLWHPDYARLSADLKTVSVWDWKSGLSTDRYDPRFAPDQLLRYAWGFSRLYPTITTAELHLWHVNPHNPLSETPLHWTVDLTEPEQYAPLIVDPIIAITHMPEFPANPGCWLCGFCSWAHCCPATDEISRVLTQTPEDARTAWALREHAGNVADMISKRRAALKAQVDSWVATNGPLDLGDGTSYGPRAKSTVKVKSIKALLQEAQARERDVAWALQVNSKRRHDLAEYVGASDPFADADKDNAPWESVVVTLATTNEVIKPEPEQASFDESEDFE